MVDKIKEEDLNNVDGGYSGIYDIQKEIACPYCGTVNLCIYSKTRITPGTEYVTAGSCLGFAENKCNAEIYFDLKKRDFFFVKEDK